MLTDTDIFTVLFEALKWGIIIGVSWGLIYAILRHRE